MRHLIILSLALAATPCVPASAADRRSPNEDSRIVLSSNPYIATGMHRDDVAAQLGAPSETFSAEIWIYWDFRAKGRPAEEKADTLIVVFTNDRVSRLRLSERQPVIALLTQLRRRAAERNMIAAGSVRIVPPETTAAGL